MTIGESQEDIRGIIAAHETVLANLIKGFRKTTPVVARFN